MGFIKEFKAFAMKGSVIDLAVAVVIGAAFGKIIDSFVGDILMPLIGILTGGIDFTGLSITVGAAEVKYGNFIQAAILFLIVAFAMFLVIKAMNSFKKKEAAAPPPGPTPTEKLLTEIRDALKK